MDVSLHHVSLVTRDPEQSAAFYQSIFGLNRLDRPSFKIEGVWLACGPHLQLHLTKHLSGNFRSAGVDNNDVHFAFRTDDLRASSAASSPPGSARTPAMTTPASYWSTGQDWRASCNFT